MTADERLREELAAETYALADDKNLLHLLVWRRVKARAEAGGFNGVIIHDYAHARAALERLFKETEMT
jgi:Mlc titration factor MtfA (ptsG expression regulator)